MPPSPNGINHEITLDQDALRLFYTDTCGEDPDFMQEMVILFLESIDRLIRDLEQGIDEVDQQLVRRTAHTLKSSSLLFGAVWLAQNCQQVETLAKEGRMGEIPGLATLISQQARHLHTILPQQIAKIGTEA
jgi:HPt (histidine-containing phosphotransfer) domain-containing protein